MVLVLAFLPAGAAGAAGPGGCPERWVGSWSTSPSDQSLQTFSRQTVRMIVTPHLGGRSLRLRLSNRAGSAPATVDGVTVGRRGPGAAVVAGTVRGVAFDGKPTVTIPAGQDAVSDPVTLTFAAFEQLAVSAYVAGTLSRPSEHFVTRQTSYLSPAGSGDHAADESGAAFVQPTTTAFSNGWFLLSGVDVLAPGATGAVVTFGDSITDGFQSKPTPTTEELSTIDADTRYPDFLARRLIAAKLPLSVLNAGISGNRVLQDGLVPPFGPKGVDRFAADVLAQPGVSQVIVLEGINDIGQTRGISAADLIGGYTRLIAAAHAAGLPIQLGTLTPSGGNANPAYGAAAADALRQQVNAWIRGQRLADGVIDFDAAVRDPQDPSRIEAPYDGSDHLHFSPAGYEAMARAIDLTTLARPACAAPAKPRCTSRRVITVRVPSRYRRALLGGRVLVDGRRVATLRRGRTSARVDLRGRTRGTVRVRMQLTLRGGRSRTVTREFRTCTRSAARRS